jgi:Domain of unknown function (DUF4145)
MSSFGPVDVRRAPCPSCNREQRVDTLYERQDRWSDEDADIQGISEYYVFQCRGCENVFFSRSRSNSEDVYEFTNDNGEYEREYPFTKDYFPQTPKHQPRHGLGFYLQVNAPKMSSLLLETYRAVDAGLNTLAAIGTRTTFDSASEYLGIDTELSFSDKLEELRRSGKISGQQKGILEVLIDAGGAAAHRGWKPSDLELSTLLGILEDFIDNNFIKPLNVDRLKKNIPLRRGKSS